jgi:hypothetical protein
MQIKCSIKDCESVTEVENPSPTIRFICRNHERAVVKKFLGVKRYDSLKDEDRNARFDNHAFEREFRKNGPNRDGEQPDQDFSTGVVGIPFDRT